MAKSTHFIWVWNETIFPAMWEFQGVEVVMSVSACRNLRVWKSHVPQIALVVRVWTWRATKTDNCGYAENVACNVSESVRVCVDMVKAKLGKHRGLMLLSEPQKSR